MKPGSFNRGRGRGGGGGGRGGGNRKSGGPSPGNKNQRQSQSPGNKKPFGQIQPFKGTGTPSPNPNKSFEKTKQIAPKSANKTPVAKSPGNLGKKSPGKSQNQSPKPAANIQSDDDDDDIEDSDEEVEFDSEEDDEEISPEVMNKLRKLQQQQGEEGDDAEDSDDDLDEDDDDNELDMEEIKKLMAQASDDDEDDDDEDDDDDDLDDSEEDDAEIPSAGPMKAGNKRPAELDTNTGAGIPPAKVNKTNSQSATPARGAKRPAADESPKSPLKQEQQQSSNSAKKVKVETKGATEAPVAKIPVPDNVLKEIKQVFSSFGRRSVYIRPVPRNCTAAMLKELSKESINSRIPYDIKKKRNRHYAFLEYKDEQTAAKCAKLLNGKNLGDTPLVASLAVSEDVDISAINPYELFISNLAKKTTQEQVSDLFANAYEVKMPVQKDKSSAGFAFAKFSDASEALKAFKSTNGAKLHDNAIKVVFGKSEELKQQIAAKKQAEYEAWKKSKVAEAGAKTPKANAETGKTKPTIAKKAAVKPANTANNPKAKQTNGKAANAQKGKANAQGKKGKKNKIAAA